MERQPITFSHRTPVLDRQQAQALMHQIEVALRQGHDFRLIITERGQQVSVELGGALVF